jgi:hypothetical protein
MGMNLKARLRAMAVVASIALFATTAAGCFGRFRIVNTVYDFNRGIGNKLVRTLAMWGMVIIPVYEVAALADVFIFNVVDFWSQGGAVTRVHRLPDGGQLSFIRAGGGDTLHVRWTDARGRGDEVELVKVGPRAGYVRRPDGAGGRVLATVELTDDGQIVSRGN